MARPKNPAYRAAILEAAVHEIAKSGLGASTAKIAKRAGIAAGTLFTYFPTKEDLLNELYFELKAELYANVNASFPYKASLKDRTRHLWTCFLDWAIESPDKRKVSIQLNVSDIVTNKTRVRCAAARGAIDRTLADLSNRALLRELPDGFAAATMSAMQEATMDFVHKQPRHRKDLIDRAFQVFWRAVG